MKKEVTIAFFFFSLIIFTTFASAGVGIKWSQESFLVSEGEKTCLSYSVYNPWPEDSSVRIEVSDNLKSILISQEAETRSVPANTSSAKAIPLDFCFEIPEVYSKKCIIEDFLCKKDCLEEQLVYEGEISIKSFPADADISGSGGSTTEMSVSAPLRLRITCTPHSTDYRLVYILLAVISLIGIIVILYRRFRKPEKERKKEELERLKKEMKNLKSKK
jgi:hypothetical protein